MSSSKIHTPENFSPVSSSEKPSSTGTGSIFAKKWLLGIGLIVIGFFMFLILKSFSPSYFSLISKKENFTQSMPGVSAQENTIQLSQGKIEDQVPSSPAEALPSSNTTNSIEKLNDSSSIVPPVPTETPPVPTETPPVPTETPPAPTETPPIAAPQVPESMPPVASSTEQILSNPTSSDSPSTETKAEAQIPAVPQVDVLALENKIQSLEERLREEENQKIHQSQIWLKFQQLQMALEQSKNFETELQQFSILFLPQAKIFESLHGLEPYAKTGLPSLDELLQKFVSVKQEISQMLEQQEKGSRQLRLQLMPWIQIYNTQIADPALVNLWTLANIEKAVMTKNLDQIIEIILPLRKDNLPTLNLWCQQLQNYQHLGQIKNNLLDQTIFEIVQPLTSKPSI